MTYHLDTNIVVALLKNKPARVRERLRQVASENALIAVSTVVLFELWYGVARSGRPEENTERLRVFLASDISVVPFEEGDAAIAGNVRAALETAGAPIGPYDLLIAAQALRAGATLATANVSEFARVPGNRDAASIQQGDPCGDRSSPLFLNFGGTYGLTNGLTTAPATREVNGEKGDALR